MGSSTKNSLLAGGQLLHAIKGAAGLEPTDLLFVEGVVQLDLVDLAVGMLDLALQRLGGRKASQTQDGDLVGRLNLKTYIHTLKLGPGQQRTQSLVSYLIVIGRIGEGQRQHALLLQVRLVDARKRLDNDRPAAQMTGLQSGVLSRRTLTVVLIADRHPADALRLVVTRNVRNRTPIAGQLVLDVVRLLVLDVDGTV